MNKSHLMLFGIVAALAVFMVPAAYAQSAGEAASPPPIDITYPDTGVIVHGGTAVLGGTAPPNYDVYIYDDSAARLAHTTAGADGAWSAQVRLPDGMHFVMAVSVHDGDAGQIIEAACTSGPAACALALNESQLGFDTIFMHVFGESVTDPVQPEMTLPISGSTITENTFVMRGVSEPGASVVISDVFQRSIGTTTADAAGMWSMQITDHNGIHIYSIIASTAEHPNLHTMAFVNIESADDPMLPHITSPASGALVTDGNNFVATGTATPGSLIVLVDLLSWPLAMAFADGSGDWAATVNLADGPRVLVATQIAVDGTVAAHSNYVPLHVDSGMLALERPVITSHDPISLLQRESAVALSGTATPNSMISIINYDAEVATTTSDGTGAWSVVLNLPDGLYSLSAVASNVTSTGDSARSGFSESVIMFVTADDEPDPKICR